MRSTQFVVDINRIERNIIELKKNLSTDSKILAVVKADAYGHGAVRVASELVADGLADFLGVATAEEGIDLIKNGINAPILVLGPVNADEYEMCFKGNYDVIRHTVFEKEQLLSLNNIASEYGKKALVHIKINSGMNRIGIGNQSDFLDFIDTLKKCPSVVAEGIFTHFATADGEDLSRTEEQINVFRKMISVAEKSGLTFRYKHAANTSAAIRGLCNDCNMFRLGIGIYGYYPSEFIKQNYPCGIEPAGEFITRVSSVHEINKGDAVSYGATFIAEKKMQIATLSVGYADGYKRALSSKGKVIINGKLAPILGRICMDQMMVDVSGIDGVKVGTEAVLIGKRGNVSIDADELAAETDTISYEILTSVAGRVEKVYKK